jgi:NTP pyrophosphatase (non-canonical NTP hydrolase)
MNITEYAPLARRTLKELPYHQHLIHMGLGLAGEIGELLDAIKKHVVYGKPLDTVNLTEELGDDYWYAGNLLPELRVQHEVFQNAMRAGVLNGQRRRAEIDAELGEEDRMWIVALELLHLNGAMAIAISRGLLHQQLMSSQPPEAGGANASSMLAVSVTESISGILGTIGGLLGLDEEQAMRLNIAKLAKRYGDRFSDVAALNRDLGAERAVLEGKPAPAVVGTESGALPRPAGMENASGEELRAYYEGTTRVESGTAVLNVPHDGTGTLDLADDKLLEGGCAIDTDGPCESCQ